MLFKRKIPLVQQDHESECGLAVAAMVLRYFGVHVSLLDLEDRYGVPRGGTTFTNLKKIFTDYQIECQGVRISDVSDLRKLSGPLICHWNSDHFVVLEKCDQNSYVILDPGIGKMKLTETEFIDSFSGVALIFGKEKAKAFKFDRKIIASSLCQIVWDRRRDIARVLALTVCIQLLALAIVLAQRWVVDAFTINSSSVSLSIITVTVILAFICYYLVQRSRIICLTRFQLAFEEESSHVYMQKMVDLPLSFFSLHGSGDLLFRINSIGVIQQIISQKVLLALVDLAFAVVYLTIMLVFSPVLTLVVCALVLLIAGISIIYSIRNRDLVAQGIHKQISSQQLLVEYFEAIETFKCLGIENAMVDRWKLKFSEKLAVDKQKGLLAANLNTVSDSLSFILPISVLCIGVQLSLNGNVTLGTVVSFLSLSGSFLSPVMTLLDSYSQLLIAKSYFVKLAEILDKEQPTIASSVDTLPTGINSLGAADVSFRYSLFDPPCVNQLNLNISKGDRIAIVGPSGSGKTTILKLLSNTLFPSSGTICVNEIDVASISRTTLQQHMVYCSQNSAVFAGSILENITCGKQLRDEDYSLLNEVCIRTGLSQLIADSPMGIYTNIVSGGNNLSGGQKQRIVLARAIFSQADILLLDEPTSALDSVSEAHIFDYLQELSRTVVIVAHRLETVKRFDRIYVVNNGSIVESGKHEELLQKGGLYTQLYQ